MSRPDQAVDGPLISVLGSSALLFEAPGPLSIEQQRRIWWMAQEAIHWPGVREAVPGMNNLMLTFARAPASLAPLESLLRKAWSSGQAVHKDGKLVELPVVYGGPAGPHLVDVITHTGLPLDQIVAIHCRPVYTVFALGSHPGYCYLGGMDIRIATPRRRVPLTNLPGGSVSIGGIQTGVSASAGPSGWNTIGRTALKFFDPARDPPALLSPGDMIRFTVQEVVL
ncbi:MAG: 5-oxoprolinase subunit PxpB [Burkholderiaceae bacterium]